jgi:hypothetical protein
MGSKLLFRNLPIQSPKIKPSRYLKKKKKKLKFFFQKKIQK